MLKPHSEPGSLEPSKGEIMDSRPVDLTKPLDSEGFPHLRKNSNGLFKPKCTIPNVEHLLRGYHITARYNVISKEFEILIPGQSSVTENIANVAIENINSLAAINDMPIGQVPKYVGVIASQDPINPVANWITSKPWDGRDRLPDICNTLTIQEGYPAEFKVTLMTNWLISAVAAATLPSGFHNRGVLTLQGPQGIGKTSWVRSLIPDSILRDNVILTGHHLDPSNRDSVTTAIKHWIVEIGELDSSFKKDIARLKGFVTQGTDKMRRPYDRTDSEYQRRTIFCATVNEVNFLIDKTGNTRFWVIPVVSIDYSHGIDMQQVFAQLKHELEAGASWWLTPEEDVQLEALNRSHRAVSVLEEKMLDAFDFDLPLDRWSNLSATEVLEYLGYQKPLNTLCRDCGGILRDHIGLPKTSHGIAKWKVPLDSRKARSL